MRGNVKYCPNCNVAYEDGVKTCGHVSLATEENLQKYKDAGFNYLYIDWAVQGRDRILAVMDLAQKVGLKCVVFESTVYGLTYETTSLIVENGGTKFATQDDLNAYVANALAGIITHPAFDGVVFDDEPSYLQFQAMSEVYAAVKAAAPNAKVMVNLLPYAVSNEQEERYCGRTDYTTEVAYGKYLEEYYEKIGKDLGYVSYDDYPLLNGNHYPSTNTYVLPTYLYCNQVISDFCEEKGLQRITLYQSTVYSNRRAVDSIADIYFQMNIGMAFGNVGYAYYNYYPTLNLSADDTPADEETHENAFIVDRAGVANEIYTWVKTVTEEMQVNAKALMHFDYRGMQYQKVGTLPSADYTDGLKNDEFALLEGYSFTVAGTSGGIVLVTELYDEVNDQYGYYVVNVTDPYFESTATVTLDFGTYTNVQTYANGAVNNSETNNGSVEITLETGRGVFVMPFSL